MDSTQPLTSAVSSQRSTSSRPSPQNWLRDCCCCFKLSKVTGALILILLWNMLVGATCGTVTFSQVGLTLYSRVDGTIPFHTVLSLSLVGYVILGLVQMLYPIGGLIADVRCGRYRIILLSLFSIWLGFVFGIILGVSYGIKSDRTTHALRIGQMIGGGLMVLMFVIGFSGFQANIVQFGLDQMLDASSEKLSLFLHWFVWTECVGMAVARILSAVSLCNFYSGGIIYEIIGFTVVPFVIVCTIHLILGYLKRHWFHREKTSINPYRNVYKVLRYAAKHDKPVRHRSALTYSDDEKPPRIDFAKQKYGGPFTTEVVEDVKTFLRVLVVLAAISPMFYFDVSTVYFFPIFGLHLGRNVTNYTTCTYEWLLFQSGSLSTIFSIIIIPAYLLLVYPFIKKWVPRIITRLGVGVILKVLSVTLMFVFQALANYRAPRYDNSTCLFLSEYREGSLKYPTSPSLQFPIQTLVVLNLLDGIAAPLINTAILEFVSAQSPHTMKGLLLGVFYAFRGLLTALGCVFTLPFTQEKFWGDKGGLFDCGFYYYLSNTVLGLAGLATFLAMGRWYQYRERDDPPYRHQYVEDYYSRYASRCTGRLMEEDGDRVSYGTLDDS